MAYTYEELKEIYNTHQEMLTEFLSTGDYRVRYVYVKGVPIECVDLADLGDTIHWNQGDTMDKVYGNVDGFIKNFDLEVIND